MSLYLEKEAIYYSASDGQLTDNIKAKDLREEAKKWIELLTKNVNEMAPYAKGSVIEEIIATIKWIEKFFNLEDV